MSTSQSFEFPKLNVATLGDLGEMKNLTQYKECNKCHQSKPLIAFHKNASSKHGRRSYCKACQSKYYQAIDQRRSDKQRNRLLQKKFGISLDDYNVLFQAQNGVCASCGQEETRFDIRTNAFFHLCVDHDHETGKVRALLCSACNVSYGRLMENPKRFEALLRYHYKLQDEAKE